MLATNSGKTKSAPIKITETIEATETAARDSCTCPERTVEMGRGIIGSSFQSDDVMPGSHPGYSTQPSGPVTPPINRDHSVAFCLGQQPHPMRAEEVICRHCGSLVAGTQLGVYQVQRQLGRGRRGSAYLATHIRSQQPVTLKLL